MDKTDEKAKKKGNGPTVLPTVRHHELAEFGRAKLILGLHFGHQVSSHARVNHLTVAGAATANDHFHHEAA